MFFKRPRLPTHYQIRFEPPGRSGEEILYFSSERRKIKLEGCLFREFLQVAVPLLDGKHTLDEIQAAVAALFAPKDFERCLGLLADYHLLEDAELDTLAADVRSELEPQLNFFHELGLKPHEVQRSLSEATVAVWGLGGPGATAALAMAAAQVGNLVCVDSLPVSRADPSLAPAFVPADVGRMRSEVIRGKIAELSPRVRVRDYTDPVRTDSEASRVLDGVDFVVCCADAGMSSQFYILNRACLRARIPWTSCTVSGLEGIVGPTVAPFETACYLCYKMRAVACATDPQDEFSFQRFLDRRKQDDSGQRENHSFAVGVIGNLVGLEALKCLTGVTEPSARGRILIIDMLSMSVSKHAVLRKPWCPACFPKETAVQQ
jgi:molybdopterin-synthase adenylyltransferase